MQFFSLIGLVIFISAMFLFFLGCVAGYVEGEQEMGVTHPDFIEPPDGPEEEPAWGDYDDIPEELLERIIADDRPAVCTECKLKTTLGKLKIDGGCEGCK